MIDQALLLHKRYLPTPPDWSENRVHRTVHFHCQWLSKIVQLWRDKNVHLPIPELKLRGCVDAGCGGVPHVARFIQPGFEHQ